MFSTVGASGSLEKDVGVNSELFDVARRHDEVVLSESCIDVKEEDHVGEETIVNDGNDFDYFKLLVSVMM